MKNGFVEGNIGVHPRPVKAKDEKLSEISDGRVASGTPTSKSGPIQKQPLTVKHPTRLLGQSNETTAGPTLSGIERTMTFNEIMVEYGWKYHKVYRYFINHPRTGVKFTFTPGKRPKRFYDVPVSVVQAEWEMMHSVNRHKTDEWDRRHPYQRATSKHPTVLCA